HALGVLAYEMLAGAPPFAGASVTTVLRKVVVEEPRPLAEHRRSVPPHVDAAIAKALEKLPADRWQTVAEFADALTDAAARGGKGARARNLVIPWALAAMLALALGWMGVRTARRDDPAPGPVRFNVELSPGVTPSFTPIIRLSADGRQLFVSAMV